MYMEQQNIQEGQNDLEKKEQKWVHYIFLYVNIFKMYSA